MTARKIEREDDSDDDGDDNDNQRRQLSKFIYSSDDDSDEQDDCNGKSMTAPAAKTAMVKIAVESMRMALIKKKKTSIQNTKRW